MEDIIEQIDKQGVPAHVAVIMDGNGRWAEDRGEARVFGHLNGVESVRQTLKAATEVGVKYLTLYAFSTENWNRPEDEVKALMDLLVKTILKEIEDLHSNSVRLQAIGDLATLPEDCQAALKKAIEHTKDNERITLVLALSYSARWELVSGIRAIAKRVSAGELNVDDIDDATVSEALNTRGIPDPDLLIRTSGELRISNFLLWQIAYAELYFSEVFWPDFRKQHFFEAILDYQKRQRRFGKVAAQIQS